MKTFTKAIAATAVIFAMAAPASAAVSADIGNSIRAAAGTGSNVRVNVDGDTVILNGYVEDSYSRLAIERVAKDRGAENVINNVVRSR